MASQRRNSEPVELAGSEGSAGDSALRAALTLSAISEQPIALTWAQDLAGLSPPGLSAVDVARAVFGGSAENALEGARSLVFRPVSLKSGNYSAEVAGVEVASLAQMCLPALSLANGASTLRLRGLTHVHGASSFHDLAFGWLPVVERLGVAAEVSLTAAGFAPDGGGIIDLRVFPAPRLRGIDLSSRGLLVETQALALVANLGVGIALPLERRLSERLRASGIAAQVEVLPLPADRTRGLGAVIAAQFERVRVALVCTGQAGHPAEEVADGAVDAFKGLLARRGALPGATAEALMVPLALAASPHGAPGVIGKDPPTPSYITTAEVTAGMLTVADVIRRMLPVDIQIQGLPGDNGAITLRPRTDA
jgi:RNA 3'-terminal phosphate cyclase (ATP)